MGYLNRSELDVSIKPSEFKISLSVETAEIDRNCYVAEKRIISKLSKISIQNFNNTN